MRTLHAIAASCGNGLRPELQALFQRLAIVPYSELFVRPDGMLQSGPDPKSPPEMELENETVPNGASAGPFQCR
jgi:hypothetical protein